MTDTLPKPKRRWFQYSLRMLLVVMLIASIGFGWVSNQVRREREAMDWVDRMRGENASAVDPQSWWRRLCGFPNPVLQVSFFHDSKVGDLTPLAGMTNLKYLFFSNTKVSDLTPLARLPGLEMIKFSNTQVSDLSPLAELKTLAILDLHNTKVSEEQVRLLRKALPNCVILCDGRLQ